KNIEPPSKKQKIGGSDDSFENTNTDFPSVKSVNSSRSGISSFGSDDSSVGSDGSIQNTRGHHNIVNEVPIISHNYTIKYGDSAFFDEIGNQIPPKQSYEKSGDVGICWFTSMKMLGFRNFSKIPPSHVVGKLYNHPSNNNKDKPRSYRDTNKVIIDKKGRTWFSTEYHQEAMQKLLDAFKNNDGMFDIDVAATQGLNLYEKKLTPKTLNKLLRNNIGIYASYRTYNGEMLKLGQEYSNGAHAVVITEVNGNELIYNDTNYKEQKKAPIDQFDEAKFFLLIKDKKTISPSVDENSINKYIGKINLEKSSNQEMFEHLEKAHKKYIKNTNKVVEDTADFMSFLVQADEVVRLRYKIAIQKNLITPDRVQPDITVLPLPASLDQLISENNKNMKILEDKLDELQVPYKNLLRDNDHKNLLHDNDIYNAHECILSVKIAPSPLFFYLLNIPFLKETQIKYLTEYNNLSTLEEKAKHATKYWSAFNNEAVVQETKLIDYLAFKININKEAKTKEEVERNISLIHENNLKKISEMIRSEENFDSEIGNILLNLTPPASRRNSVSSETLTES
ncbi:MAG: hypothetical protein RL344_1403, partial [Pseudomonadota bacterium]